MVYFFGVVFVVIWNGRVIYIVLYGFVNLEYKVFVVFNIVFELVFLIK